MPLYWPLFLPLLAHSSPPPIYLRAKFPAVAVLPLCWPLFLPLLAKGRPQPPRGLLRVGLSSELTRLN